MFGQYSVSHAMFSYEKHLATSLQRLSKTHSIFKHISVSIFEHHSSVQNVQHFGAQKKENPANSAIWGEKPIDATRSSQAGLR